MTVVPVWAGYDPKQDVWTLQIHVQPGARTNHILGEHNRRLKLKIAAAAVDNKANERLITFLSCLFGVASRQVCVVHGEKARLKTVAVRGAGCKLPELLEENN